MPNLTRSQLGLLHLFLRTPGPFIGEIYTFAPGYGVSRQNLREDYFVLIKELFLQPIVEIDHRHYFPKACLLTSKGEEYIRDTLSENLEAVPEEDLKLILREGMDEIKSEAATQNWPGLSDIGGEEISTLADTYFYWAQYPQPQELMVPKEDLYFSAAEGYAKLDDTIRFSRSLRNCFIVLEEEGEYNQLANFISRTIKDCPEHTRVTIDIVADILAKPYRHLSGDPLPPIASPSDVNDLIAKLFELSYEQGKHYEFQITDENTFGEMGNRIEDIFIEAFKASNQSLFHQAVSLQNSFLKDAGSRVIIKAGADAFEKKGGYRKLVELAKWGCLVLESQSHLVFLENAPKKDAIKLVLEIIRTLYRGAVTPVRRMCREWIDFDSRLSLWTLDLLGFNEQKMRKALIRSFTKTKELLAYSPAPEEKAEDYTKPAELIAISDEDAALSSQMEIIKEMAADIKSIKEVIPQFLEVEERLADLLQLSRSNSIALEFACKHIKDSQILIENIDNNMNQMLPEIKRDIKTWIENTEKSEKLPKAEREIFLRELNKIVNMSSSGKLLTSIPLIPGFLEYQYELGVNVDLNKWVEKVRSLFKGN